MSIYLYRISNLLTLYTPDDEFLTQNQSIYICISNKNLQHKRIKI
jgi:hypothetical protein